ncbi:nucleotide sugar dehydrogenase [Corynebacterium efficiens YS-314]|uniref:Putative lipopolysaccharide biosynthesis protein n=1 Tax=Corynebacterium efficiens (strain DSM 44549 / YS-314 / AJ 12310 / JCM 11189 / NBRC 100395) TaxID=196164 RepID=Q8FSK9_COREF|nr:Vi polysaccharide biosynthesis UDP-N-acetylglucosamine C-6 dehydrogenase TviB [Corynebacterium efficiens]EEW48397.1 nucleotide sugar dehydrogenase [Corynebacterium efficiens YS-314]BAC17191.1 putative lipopolysaccharide biosynthesis protein [Corynebacterium efficiens YS-314]
MSTPKISDVKIAVIGLGYVGLPLAVEFGKQFPVIGYDINETRIAELKEGVDKTLESSKEELISATQLQFTANPEDLRAANVYLVTTPTPIDEHKKPDLRIILAATRTIASTMNPGDIVIYESTVYPGVTEEECVPVIEKVSGLKFNESFYAGYSPERINPGDKIHRLPNIVKITSGSTPEVAEFVDELYRTIITAGTHKASSIKVAEAAKVIENTQRDVNIALINELALLFNKMDIDTQAVLEAAGTKWNFLPFRPGLVGGHCIGVDPYYLTHKAQAVGHNPEIILAGRRLNDSMGQYIASQLVKAMLRKSTRIENARVLILGLTFKENTPDIRNTRVVDIIAELEDYGISVDAYDPWAAPFEVEHEYGITLKSELEPSTYDSVIVAVAHREFIEMGAQAIRDLGKPESIVYDLKYVLDKAESDLRL